MPWRLSCKEEEKEGEGDIQEYVAFSKLFEI